MGLGGTKTFKNDVKYIIYYMPIYWLTFVWHLSNICMTFACHLYKLQTNGKQITDFSTNLAFVYHLFDVCLAFVWHLFVICTNGKHMIDKWQIWASNLSFVSHLCDSCLTFVCHVYKWQTNDKNKWQTNDIQMT